jgi:hypothetical protein
MNQYATTKQIIEDVSRAVVLKYVDNTEGFRLTQALREGLIIHPIWEDYGLKTRSDGRAEVLWGKNQ